MHSQPDLFAGTEPPRAIAPEIVEMTRQRLRATLAQVKEATAIVRQEMQRIENDRILNQNTGGGSGRD